MMNTMNISGMSYEELVAMSIAIQQAINNKKDEAMKEIARAYQKALALGITEEEMKAYFSAETTSQETLAIPETTQVVEEVTPIEELVSINPEGKEENNVEKEVTSVWEHPALTAPYNPMVAKEDVSTPEPEVTPVEKTEVELSSMEELLSDDPEYKEFYAPKHPEKKSDRALPTMEELISGKPINRILCMGNLNPKGAPYRQHSRLNHVDGIIPTETATGQTLVYIPPVAA